MTSTYSIPPVTEPSSSHFMAEATVSSIMDAAGNTTLSLFENPFENMPLDSNFAWLLCALSCVFLWMIYGSCFHSRVVGFVVGSLLNQYLKRSGFGELSIGSIKFGVISGRLAFRNVRLITQDYTMIIFDGYIWFRYWMPYKVRLLPEYKLDSHRLFVHLYGLEIYYYNRTEAVAQIVRIRQNYERELYERCYGQPMPDRQEKPEKKSAESPKVSNVDKVNGWLNLRNLFSILDVKLSMFRLVLGNFRASYSLVVGGTSASLCMTYEPPTAELDPFATVITGSMKNVEASFQINPDYPDEPPACPYDRSDRKGKLKFFSAEAIQINRYFADSPTDIITLLLENRPDLSEQLMKWSVEVTLVGRTDVIYGGWIDARRAEMQHALFPPARTEVSVTNTIAQRTYSGFELQVTTKSSVYCTIYLLNEKDEVQKFVLSCDPGTEFRLFLPYVFRETGLVSTIDLKAKHLRGVTSLVSKNLLEADEMTLQMRLAYSRVHHGPQYWDLNFIWTNASVFALYEHKNMISSLIHDWTRGATSPDLLRFVPFHTKINMTFIGFELITYSNQFNWIDCSKTGFENCYMVFGGPELTLGLALEFLEFLTPMSEIPLRLNTPHIDVKMYFPESHSQSYTIASLYQRANVETFGGKKLFGTGDIARPFRDTMLPGALWCNTWFAEDFQLIFNYSYHNMGAVAPGELPRQSKEDELEPDIMELDMSIASCQMLVTGSFVKSLYNVKENYLGASQVPNAMDANIVKGLETLLRKSIALFQDIQLGVRARPLEATVVGNFTDTTAHLLVPCEATDPPCPRVFAKKIVLEVLKQHEETTLQLMINPIILDISESTLEVSYPDPMQNGQALVSYFQVRGHAMFSDVDVPPNEETVEYGWLLDLQVGDVVLRATVPQIFTLVKCLEACALTVDDTEDDFRCPEVLKSCIHGLAQPLCPNSTNELLCPHFEDIKYRMTRFSMDSLHVYVADVDSFMYLQVYPVWLSTCNFRSAEHDGALSLFIPNIIIRQFLWSHVTPLADQDVWMEVTSLKLGVLQMDIAQQLQDLSKPDKQMLFLKKHDNRSRRLRFLWDTVGPGNPTRCACFGDSEFFGRCFTPITWKGLSAFVDMANFSNEPGLEIGQRIFETADKTVEVISLENLISSFSSKDSKGGRGASTKFGNVSPRVGVTVPESSNISSSKYKSAWIPDRRRQSIGSVDSFYSAADGEMEGNDEVSEVPDLMKELDRVSVAALSQTTISTISMAPTRDQSSINVSNFPVNLHVQLSKKTQDSPLLMAGYVPQVPLWQRGIINVAIVGSENGSNHPLSRYSFYLPNLRKVKGGLDMSEAFRPKPGFGGKVAKLQIPKHYRSLSSGSGSRFVEFGPEKDKARSAKGPARIAISITRTTDIMMTPISCDALQPLIQSLDKHVSKLRPSMFLNGLYGECVASAKSRHKFDEDKIMVTKIFENLHAKPPETPSVSDGKRFKVLAPLLDDIKQSSTTQSAANESISTPKPELLSNIAPRNKGAVTGNLLFGEHPWTEKSFVHEQFSIQLDQINVVTLQCGIVEEVVETKDLSSPRDLICVSVISGSLRALSMVYARKRQITHVSKIYTDRRSSRVPLSHDRKGPVEPLSPLSGVFDLPDIVGAETKSDKVTDSVLSLTTQSAHCQLRRLRHSEIWRKARITCITEAKSGTWFDYNPKISPVDEYSPYQKLFSDLSGTDQSGFIVLEMGIDDLKVEGGGRTETDEHLDGIAPVKAATKAESDEPLTRASSRIDSGQDFETDSRQSGSSSHTFIAHASDEDIHEASLSPDVMFKLSATVGSCWLNCPTPSKKATSQQATDENSQLKGFTRLDWHFLSTANPMVDAWLYPLDRANVALRSMAANRHRNDLVLASYFLIASVNDHILPRPSKINLSRHSLKSRVLQEDCCVRLCRILQRHGLGLTAADIEKEFRKELLPPFDILMKGIFVLFKQLRYTPFARVLLEPQFLLQKLKPAFKSRDATTTLDSSINGLADDMDGTLTDGNDEDDVIFSNDVTARNHPESPYPPLEQDLNKWLDEGNAKMNVGKSHGTRFPMPAKSVASPLTNEDSDSPYEDAEFGAPNSPGVVASVENIFGPLLEQLDLKKKSPVSVLKRLIGFHAVISGKLDAVRINLVESPDFDRIEGFLAKDTFGRVTAFRSSQMTIGGELLLDIPLRSLDLFMPDYRERLIINHRVNRISVVTYRFDVAEIAQAVSMPLLRLMAQIATVITSMQRVRSNLKKNWPDASRKGHKKTDSTSTSGSGTSRSDSPAHSHGRIRGHDTYLDFITPDSSKHWKDLMMLMDLYEKPSDHRIVDETKPRTRRISGFGSRKIRGPQLSFRRQRKNSTSDIVSSSVQHSDEVPESPVMGERVLPMDAAQNGTENDLDENGFSPGSSRRTLVDNAAENRVNKTLRYGTSFAVCGIASIRSMILEASIRGLNFQAVLSALSFSHNFTNRKSRYHSLDEAYYHMRTGQLSIQLVQKMGLKGQLYLGVGLASSQVVFSSSMRNKTQFSQKTLINVRLGELHLSVPHHPITLHAMVVSGAEDLTDAIEDLKITAGIKVGGPDEISSTEPTDANTGSHEKPVSRMHHKNTSQQATKATFFVKKLIITAAPLPSLEASFEITKLLAYGSLGDISQMHFDFGPQDLIFKSKNEDIESTANFQLPPLHIKASYESIHPVKLLLDADRTVEFRDVHALYITAKMGSPDYTFSTDALKYTVLFQKVFMKEIEDVLDTLSQPIAPHSLKLPAQIKKQGLPFFHQINLQQDGIRVTGTTPTSSAVRLEIDKTAMYISNIPKTTVVQTIAELQHSTIVSVQVDLGICLGQLVKGEQQQVYEEAEMDFQPCAHFRTRMTFTNYGEGPLEALLQGYDETIRRKRIVAHLSQPRIYFQPRSVDMAVIFYINYKNAHDYWYEQRYGPVIQHQSVAVGRVKKTSTTHLPQVAQRAIQSIQDSIYVTELFISQMYVCMPLPTNPSKSSGERDVDIALLISLDRTKVRAVLAESIITSGSFDLFRLCFTEDHGPQYDYTGRPDDGFTNCCFVPKGYVEVTSRTTKKEVTESGLPKWDLYFKWDMNGIEMHMDPAIGKIISNLSDAMTAFTGEEPEVASEHPPSHSHSDEVFAQKNSKHHAKLIEKQMQMHAKVFSELQNEGASNTEIQHEAEKLKRIEQGIVNELRRDIVNRIRQKSISSRGSVSDYRAHRRTSSTPQSDLSPSTPDPDPTHARTFSADFGRSKISSSSAKVEHLSSPHKTSMDVLKEEPTSPRNTFAPEAEQAFDFDFTVLINIESGHCTFYCGPDKDKKKSIQRASSGDISFGGSSPARRGSDFARRSNLTPCCTLYIPGVNLEMQYESDGSASALRNTRGSDSKSAAASSRITQRQSMVNGGTPVDSDGKTGRINSAMPRKKGNLFATFSLESLPAETVLTPQLLDFIEQALEPIPVIQQSMVKIPQTIVSEDSETELPTAATDEAWGFESAMESFPVDIFILFMMNSTKIRCSCLPVSKVEGVLTLPSLSMMVSTRKYSSAVDMEKVRIKPEHLVSGRPVLEMLDDMLHQMGPEFRFPDFVDKYEEYGGLGLYGNLSGFSLVIFHPYGTVSESVYYEAPGERAGAKGSSHGMPDKRELVRLELDRLHVEIVRAKSMVDDFTLISARDSFHTANSIEFSASISVGKTTFWYDLRRLGEILAFPKAWYRRSITRRFFLGEEAADASSDASSVSLDHNGRDGPDDPIDNDHDRGHPQTRENGTSAAPNEDGVLPWKTLVLVGLKVSALDFNVNMGNVMGNTVLLVEDINCVGRFSAASDGHSDIFAAVVATNLDLNSRGGVVGGGSQWKKAQVYGHVRNEVGAPPMHAFGCLMSSAESRLEYMGAISALARMSKMHVRVRDTWALQNPDHKSGPKLASTVNCTWDQMQVIICSASTSHVVKSVIRVTEFFEEQLKSSRQFISKLNFAGPVVARRRSSLSKPKHDSATSLDSRFHRHWQKPLEFLRGYRLKSVPLSPFPLKGGLLKGDVQMSGRNISLACFYGNSFRGKSWARFSIKEPRLAIASEAVEHIRNDERLIEVVQIMNFNLGKDDAAPFAATVARVTCNNPPPLLNLPDWFEFMFMNSDIDEIGRFPTTHSQKLNAFEDMKLSMAIETILALPNIVIGLRSEHVQSEFPPEETATPPVLCNFTCDFGAPISIDMGDSQAFYFLHQLINSYLANTDAESVASKREVPNPTEVLKEDARKFHVNEWYLQPSFKLLQRIGRDIETIGVERVMNRLGFAQAQTTIPKWIQRGLVDPVDRGLSALLLTLMSNSQHDRIASVSHF